VSTAVDSAVLSSHDGLEPAFGFDISGEPWHFGNDNDDLIATSGTSTTSTSKSTCLEFPLVFSSAHDTVYKGGCDLVGDRSSRLGCGDTAKK
jgi:hypothetical protein